MNWSDSVGFGLEAGAGAGLSVIGVLLVFLLGGSAGGKGDGADREDYRSTWEVLCGSMYSTGLVVEWVAVSIGRLGAELN